MDHVIVMCDMGEPRHGVAVRRVGPAAHIVNPGRLRDLESGRLAPTGFPTRCVFRFDEGLFGQLKEQWDGWGHVDPTLWERAEPLYPEA